MSLSPVSRSTTFDARPTVPPTRPAVRMGRWLGYAGPVILVALGGMNVAFAQSSSPFATKKKTQAWETAPAPTSAPTTAPAPTPAYVPPAYTPPATPAPSYAPPTYTAPTGSTPDYSYSAPTPVPTQNLSQTYGATAAPTAAPPSDGNYYPGRQPTRSLQAGSPTAPTGVPAWEKQMQNTPNYGTPAQPTYPTENYGAENYGAGNYGQTAQNYPPQNYPGPNAPQSWKDRLGLGSIATLLRGGINLGTALSYRDVPPNQVGANDGYREDFIADANVEFEASTVTQGGLEYGVNLDVHAQYDPYRRGFGGRTPTCPPTVAGCSTSVNDGVASGLRGHTSQFYQFGTDNRSDTQISLESAHLFLRSAYGDVTIGRDDGAAYLFSLGAPTLLAVNASNSPVDYTGLDSVRTINDASGFAEKLTYTSPRLLGDTVGVGVQFGASYALDAKACGVDYCNGKSIDRVISPDLEDVMEFGLALDRTFDNGLSVEGTVTYATASEKSGLNGLDDLSTLGAGLEMGYGQWTLGGSYLQSNNGLLDGDYKAYDAGVTWKPGALGFTLGYGHATDDNIGLTSDQGVFGVSYDFKNFTLGTGVQYVDRRVNGLSPIAGGNFALAPLDQKATSLFVEGGFKF